MSIAYISIGLLLITASVSLGLMLALERRRAKRLRKDLATEFAGMTDSLGKVAFGLLNQRMEARVEADRLGSELAEGLAAMRVAFNRITSEPLNRILYVGTDAWLEGIACARCVGEALGGKGMVAVVVTSSLAALKMAQRHRSFLSSLSKEYPSIRIAETFEAHADAERTRAFVREKAGGLDAIYVTGNSMAGGAALGIADAGRAGSVFLLCHDLDAGIVEGLRKGLVSATLFCSSYAQGRDSVIGLYNHIVSGWKPAQARRIVDSRIVTRDKLGDYWDESAREPSRASARGASALMPQEKSPREVRILVFCEDWNEFMKQTAAGAAMAAQELESFGARVVVRALNQVKRPPAEAIAEAEAAIAAERKRGLHGVVSFVGIEGMVEVLNRAAAAGIPVATFDSEPLGLRSMVQWLLTSSARLERFTAEYQAGHREIDLAMREILPEMSSMVGRSGEEARLAKSGSDSVAELSGLIEKTSVEEAGQADTVKASADIANRLSEMVAFLETRVEGLRDMGESVRRSSEKAEKLRGYSDRIQSIIGLIDDISDRTNILAFNAAVEATHAGDKGRGFKVISGEIRSLADKSVASTRDIALLIEEMRGAISEDIEANARSQAIVEEEISAIGEASSRLAEMSGRLLDMMGKVRDAVARNSAAMEEMREFARSMNGIVSENSRISSDNSATIESIGGAYTEVGAQFAEMIKQTSQLEELVAVLEGTVSAFSA